MSYDTPQIHEVGMAEEVIQGPTSAPGSDIGEFFPPALTLEDFDE